MADYAIIIPAYNEGLRLKNFLPYLIEEIKKMSWHGEIIIADDGSSPEHHQAYQELIQGLHDPSIRLLALLSHQGKGSAIQMGFKEANATWVGYVDADGATPAREVVRLLQIALSSNDLSGVFGSRIRMLGYQIERNVLRHLMGRLFVTLMFNFLSIPAYDCQCGCKFFKRSDIQDVLAQCRETGYLLDIEIIALGLQKDLKFREAPIDWKDVAGGKVRVVHDSLEMLRGLFRIKKRLSLLNQ